MSTRSTIGIEHEDGTVQSVYCHFDGYLSGVGLCLLHQWNTRDKVISLVSQGGISVLGNTLEESVFYARDRGEPLEFSTSPSLEEHPLEQEYAYVFTKEGFWVYESCCGKGVLTDAACAED